MANFVKEWSRNEVLNEDSTFYGSWDLLPHTVLFQIFQYLCPRDLINAGLTCTTWLNACYDNLLWKDIVYSYFQIDRGIRIPSKKQMWWCEYKRLTYHIPFFETEVLRDHKDEVLHVSFSHNGKTFATCSKDGSVLVWDSRYPAKIKYRKNMNDFNWEYTHFSQFNESDTLLLVSGVHTGLLNFISGEIAVFSLEDGFKLQCRVQNKPYDIFGTWFSDHYLLSGDYFTWRSQVSASILFLNKASQETESEHLPIITEIGKFLNYNGNFVRTVMVANCLPSLKDKNGEQLIIPDNVSSSVNTSNISNETSDSSDCTSDKCNDFQYFLSEERFLKCKSLGEDSEFVSPIYYNQNYQKVEESQTDYLETFDAGVEKDDIIGINFESNASELKYKINEADDLSETNVEKLLIFTTGGKACVPHQIGFKKIKPGIFPKKLDPGPSLAERVAEKKRTSRQQQLEPEPDSLKPGYFMELDHLLELNGHIIGMTLSPDQRYLYVNSRPWPEGCEIENPMHPPPIAQQIHVHVIDLVTLKEVGTMFQAHKAYTPSSKCFSIFLSVSNEYVASVLCCSGAEDKHGYLWDRHYGISLAKYPHDDVVSSVALNPQDSEMLVTTSHDHTIKIWRSRNMVKQLNIKHEKSLPKGVDVRFEKKNAPRGYDMNACRNQASEYLRNSGAKLVGLQKDCKTKVKKIFFKSLL